MNTSRILVSVFALLALAACTHEKPNFIYMPDMVYSPAFKAQKGEQRMPVKGTIPRGFVPYAYAKDPDAAGREMKNPLEPTHAVLMRGQAMYNTYCIVCHGPKGLGDGTVVGKYPRPPSLQSEKVQNGRMEESITTSPRVRTSCRVMLRKSRPPIVGPSFIIFAFCKERSIPRRKM